MDPTTNATYELISTLVAELDPIFPAEFPFWHMGGDEVQYNCWRDSTDGYVDKFMKDHGINEGDYPGLQGYFEQRVIDLVRSLPSRKRTVLWEDNSKGTGHGVSGLPKDAVVQLFHEDNGDATVLDATVSGGWQVFYTTRDWYWDHGKTLTDGSWEYAYGLEPYANSTLPGAQLDAAVLGSESCMWSPHFDSTNFMTEAFPRAAAVAERLWSPRVVTDVADARARLQQLSYSYDEVDDNDVEDDEDAAATAQHDGGADGNVDDTEAEDLGAHEGTAAAADDPVSSQLDHDERILHKWNCARVHGMDHVEGVFLVCSSNFYCWDGYHIQPDGTMVEVAQPAADVPKGGWSFQQDATDSGEVNDDELPPDRCHIPGEGASVSIPHKLRKWSYTSVREVHKRRYQLRLTGLEFFSIDGDQGDLVIFPSAQNVVSQVYKAIMKRTGMPHNDQFGIRDDELRESGATEMTRSGRISRLLRTFTTRWQQGSMSNFEYLMRLNTMAHRSYNDLTQYPVFPWVLADYTSDELDLDDPRVYRDLSKPMGALTEPRRSRFKERFDSWADDDPIPAFHYGSHYSSSATVLHYLIRLEPFTQHSYELQSGRFDIADRLFFSVQEASHRRPR